MRYAMMVMILAGSVMAEETAQDLERRITQCRYLNEKAEAVLAANSKRSGVKQDPDFSKSKEQLIKHINQIISIKNNPPPQEPLATANPFERPSTKEELAARACLDDIIERIIRGDEYEAEFLRAKEKFLAQLPKMRGPVLAEYKETVSQATIICGLAPVHQAAIPSQPKPTIKMDLYVLKDGQHIRCRTMADSSGDKYVQDEAGKTFWLRKGTIDRMIPYDAAEAAPNPALSPSR